MAAADIEVRELVAGFGATRIVDNVSLRVTAGSRLSVLGRNGMGKTTLLASLMGLSQRHAGKIILDGVDVSTFRPSARAAQGFGYVPQTRDVFPSLTVEENLVAGQKGGSRDGLDEAYAMFPRLRERRKNLGGQLSGGEQQMLSTARAILGRPTVLLMDEPLEGLAPIICDELMASFDRLAASRQMTFVLVEQQIERALDFADDVIILERGRIAWSGKPEVLRQDQALIERYIGIGIH